MDILSSELAPAQAARIGAQLLDVDKSELYDLIVQRRKP
jgi:hypothetical protein